MKIRSQLLLLAALPATALAHPGHGVLDGFAHLFEAEHILPAIVAAGLVAYLLVRRKDGR